MHATSLQPVSRETESTDSAAIASAPVDLSHGVGRTLRALRKARKLTQREVANRAGVSTSAVSELETGRNNLSIDMLWRLCVAMGFRPHVTIRGKDSRRPLLAIELASADSDSSELTPTGSASIRIN